MRLLLMQVALALNFGPRLPPASRDKLLAEAHTSLKAAITMIENRVRSGEDIESGHPPPHTHHHRHLLSARFYSMHDHHNCCHCCLPHTAVADLGLHERSHALCLWPLVRQSRQSRSKVEKSVCVFCSATNSAEHSQSSSHSQEATCSVDSSPASTCTSSCATS
jgi:hypothetical protein